MNPFNPKVDISLQTDADFYKYQSERLIADAEIEAEFTSQALFTHTTSDGKIIQIRFYAGDRAGLTFEGFNLKFQDIFELYHSFQPKNILKILNIKSVELRVNNTGFISNLPTEVKGLNLDVR